MEPVPVIDDHFKERIQKIRLNFANEESLALKNHLMALLTNKPKVIETHDCWQILGMMNKNFKTLSGTKLYKLGEVLKYYVKAYPHWGELDIVDEWFTEFTLYLMLKMDDAWKILSSLKGDDSDQPTIKACKYSIELEGPPNLTYSAVFNVSNGDVVGRQHVTRPFSMEKYKSGCKFINLPYVSVKANFVDISFERKNVHVIDRFITMAPMHSKKNYSKNVKVERINEDQEVSVYTLHFYTMYFRQFMELLRNEPKISEIRRMEYRLVIEEILEDMEEAFGGNIVPSNARITFTIGDNIYIRNKQTATRDINYYEIITPEVALSIYQFDAIQDLNDKQRVTFESLNTLERNKELLIEHINSSRIVFECLLCQKCFRSLFTIQAHFKEEHREEHSVTCGMCRRVIDVASLVGNRWRHGCRSNSDV